MYRITGCPFSHLRFSSNAKNFIRSRSSRVQLPAWGEALGVPFDSGEVMTLAGVGVWKGCGGRRLYLRLSNFNVGRL